MKCFLVALCLVLTNSAAVLPCQNPASSVKSSEIPADFVIGLEDILAVNVWREPELSVKEVPVRPDGKISLPLVGDVQASGMTTKQLQERITEKLKEFVAAPTVTVAVLKIGSQYVSIVGQVAKPGVYYLGSPITVLELLARAGGISEYGNKKRIAIVRKEGQQTKHLSFNFKDVAKGINLQQNIVLKNGDVVIVP